MICWRNHDDHVSTRNDIVDDSLSTMAFNVAKIASSASIVTKSSMISLRVAGPLRIKLGTHRRGEIPDSTSDRSKEIHWNRLNGPTEHAY